MSQVTIITGSPSKQSRSAALSEYIAAHLQDEKYEVKTVHIRDLPAEDLVYANFSSPAIQEAQKKVADADAVIIVSPIYKASYTGILKTFLDLIPEKGLHNKTVLPIATGGTIAHLLALDYVFKPTLSILGATALIHGVYIVDSEVAYTKENEIEFIAEEAEARIKRSLKELGYHLEQTKRSVES